MKFDELNQLLIDSRCTTRAAECHGFLCGYICIHNDLDDEVVWNCLLADAAGADQSCACLAGLQALAADVRTQMAAPDFSLQLLLPDDSRPLRERGVSFIQWCEGFLSGIGAAGVMKFYTLSSECRELLDDLYKICRLDPDTIDDAGAEERALTELIEYVRMGAIMMHDELRRSDDTDVSQPVLH